MLRFTTKQQIAAEAIAIGKSQTEAAKMAGVIRETVSRWMADPQFAGYLEDARRKRWEAVNQVVTDLCFKAVKVLSRILDSKDSGDGAKIRACALVLMFAGRRNESNAGREIPLSLDAIARIPFST